MGYKTVSFVFSLKTKNHFVYGVEVYEGIIAKGREKHELWMIKVKTYQYLERLKKEYKEHWDKYWE